MLDTLRNQPLVPAVILAAIIGVLVLRYLNRKPATPKKPRPQQRPSKRKKR